MPFEDPLAKHRVGMSAMRGVGCSNVAILAGALACVAAAGIIGVSIYLTGRRLQPALEASLPILTNAGSLLGSVERMGGLSGGGTVAALIDRSVSAADAALPAVERAAAMINHTSQLIERVNQLARHPTLRIDLEG